MILFETNEIVIGEEKQTIKNWTVAFKTPIGIVSSFEDAKQVCDNLGVSYFMGITPKVVVMGESIYEIWD